MAIRRHGPLNGRVNWLEQARQGRLQLHTYVFFQLNRFDDGYEVELAHDV